MADPCASDHARRIVAMLDWLLAVLGLFVLQTFVPPALRYFGGGRVIAALRIAAGPRDQQPPMPIVGERATRALANMHEALPVFLALALLHMLAPSDTALASRGAAVFFFARLVYVPAYMSGVIGLRSALWVVSWVGLAMMIAALSP
jgi:uncharacterized MAPEG superfamily protein